EKLIQTILIESNRKKTFFFCPTIRNSNGRTLFLAWNTKMYPIWKDGDPRYQESWRGGRVIFNVGNDSPTLTGAKVTFTIDLEFPHNQKVLPGGNVVWAEDCVVNGTKYFKSEPVYSAKDPDWEAVFPDGTPVRGDKKPAYVFVWKAWGQYWQVADGPSSSLTINTDDIPLGSYTMDIVIYHYRSKEKFIPLGYASTQFSITDQIPFAVSLDQVNDIVAGDMRFVQNRAIAFTVALHDPSEYLGSADITFNWDFGDESGALISRELTVTHTYVSSGSFRPQVVIQAVIPDKACDPPSDTPTSTPGPPVDGDTTGEPGGLPTLHGGCSGSVQQTASCSSLKAKGTVRLSGQAAAVVVAKRDAGDKPSDDDCVIYRYGSFCTGIEEGVYSRALNQARNKPSLCGTSTRFTSPGFTSSLSLPKEVCSVILDSKCLKPIHMACNMVEPSKECQLVLRHFFNSSGVYCINVSMANDVSLAATSAKFTVDMSSGLSSSGTIVMLLGILVLILAVGIIGYSYKRLKPYRPLKEDKAASEGPQLSSTASMLWGSLNRGGAVDSSPLLQDGPL
uniref:Premelanosome protein b n=1 Tax=Fundulus heteroclitus TaxID=8078 RepID=A0A3Q2PE84_FUNHE